MLNTINNNNNNNNNGNFVYFEIQEPRNNMQTIIVSASDSCP